MWREHKWNVLDKNTIYQIHFKWCNISLLMLSNYFPPLDIINNNDLIEYYHKSTANIVVVHKLE